MFSLFNFSSIFPGGSTDPIFRYVRTPMCSTFLHATPYRGWGQAEITQGEQEYDLWSVIGYVQYTETATEFPD